MSVSKTTTASRQKTRIALSAALLTLVTAMSPALASPAFASSTDATEGRDVLGAGQHVDALYPVIENNRLEVRTLTPDGEVDPDDVVLHIPETTSSLIELPEGYGFLGKEGNDAWISTLTQDTSVVWPGWSAEGIGATDLKGTVKYTFAGFSYAGEGSDPMFAITQPGGLSGEKVNPVIAPGTPFVSTTAEPQAHVHGNWLFSEKGAYDIEFTVSATLADGTAVSDDATVRFLIGEPGDATSAFAEQPVNLPAPPTEGVSLSPNRIDAEYYTGMSIAVTASSAAQSTAPEASVHWFVRRDGETEFTRDEMQKTEVYSAKPVRALDNAEVVAKVVAGDGVVLEESSPLLLRVATNPVWARITAEADATGYGIGETAKFTTTQTSTDYQHYHWYIRLAGSDSYEWIPESRSADLELPISAEMQGASVIARLFTDDHASISDSKPIIMSVTDAASAVPAAPLKVESPAIDSDVREGSKVELTAAGVDDAGRIEWLVRQNGENPFIPIADATTASVSIPADASWNGAEIMARTVGTDGSVTQESASPTVLWIAGIDETAVADADGSRDGVTAGFPAWAFAIVGGSVLLVILLLLLMRRRRSRSTT